MDTESEIKGRVLSLVRGEQLSTVETFVTNYLKELKSTPREQQPNNVMIIEYAESDELSSYNLRVGGTLRMRPHHLIGILHCVADDISNRSNVQ